MLSWTILCSTARPEPDGAQPIRHFPNAQSLGETYLTNHITADGYTYSIFGPPALVGFPFADYRVVVLDWSDTESIEFDPPYTSVIPALETYISNGGVVWIEGAIQNGFFPLPFGGTAT